MIYVRSTLAGVVAVVVLGVIYFFATPHSRGTDLHLTFVPLAIVSLGPSVVGGYLWGLRHWLSLLATITFATAFWLEFRSASRATRRRRP